jgi:hypothetical protein
MGPKRLLPSMPKRPCYIVMDNAAFHRKMAVSRSKMTVADIKSCLMIGISHPDDAKKADLLLLMDEKAPIRPKNHISRVQSY